MAPKKTSKKDWKSQHGHLFPKTTRNFGIGQAIQPKRDLSRYVKWPRYVRIQRQRAVLKKRLKVPPAVDQFTKTLDRNQATNLFRLLSNYRPESRDEKKQRLLAKAEAEAKNETVKASGKPKVIKFGLNHVTQLIESRKAKLVVIAHDVDPIELVVWLPALCRKMDVPFCIVKGKARLGQLTHQKTAAAVAITDVRKEHQGLLDQIIGNVRPMYETKSKTWGGGVMGLKTQAVIRKREAAAAKEAAKIASK